MKKLSSKQRGNISFIIIFVIVILLLAGAAFFIRGSYTSNITENQAIPGNSLSTPPNNLASYTSQNLKFSLQYPSKWTLIEKDFSILIASYPTVIGENKPPTSQQIKIFIDDGTPCQDTLDKEVVYGGCAEGKQMLNQILKKETKQLDSGTLYTYLVKYPQDNSEQTRYYLVNGKNILFISKQPDPSQFDTEFEGILNSIKFL